MNWLLTSMEGWNRVFELYSGSHLLSTAILVSVVALVCHFIPLRPVVQHALWFVALLRFVLPSDVAPSHVVSIPSWIIPLPGAAEAWFSDISESFRVPRERVGDAPGLWRKSGLERRLIRLRDRLAVRFKTRNRRCRQLAISLPSIRRRFAGDQPSCRSRRSYG